MTPAISSTSNRLRTLLEESGPHKIAILGIPYDANSSFMHGPAKAPPIIRKSLFSDSSNLWTETGVDLGGEAILLDAGDLSFGGTDESMSVIKTAVALLLDHHISPILLGGDHFITYPILKAFRRKYAKLSVLHFDAHPDLYHAFQENRHSHASAFARIMEEHLADRLVQVGIRTMNGHQRAQAEKFGVEVVEMRHWQKDFQLRFDTPVYVSLDMDALDPSCAPGVSHREPGGFTTRQVITALQTLEGSIVGADIVEFNPQNDALGLTPMTAAKILKEIAAQIIMQRGVL